jgi:hypothetical protein
MCWLLTKYTKVHTTKGWWKPHNPNGYQNVYFNENLHQYKCKISCFQSFQLKSTQTRGFSIMCWLLTKYTKVHTTKKWWKPHNPKGYQNVYFNENLHQYKWKISWFQSFQLKSTQTRGFSVMCWLFTKYYKVHAKKWWKPHNTKNYQNVYFNENLHQYKCKISCFQSFLLKSTQTRGFSIMCWLLTKYDWST